MFISTVSIVNTCSKFCIFLLLDTVGYHWLRVQVDEEEDYYDGTQHSDYESDDSNGI